jgi:hypothetical protein
MRLVLGVFIFALTMGSQDLIAKEKYHKEKKVSAVACKVEKEAPVKKSRVKKYKAEKTEKVKSVNNKKPVAKKKQAVKAPEKKVKKSNLSKIFVKNKKESKAKTEKIRAEKAKKTQLMQAERSARKAKWREDREKREREADYQRRLRQQRLVENQNKSMKARTADMKKWKTMRVVGIDQDYADGMYADLYKRPAWPFHMLWADNTNLLQVKAGFEHATNWFDSTGSSKDLTAGEFGEQDFTFRDILLALDLNKREVGGDIVLDVVDDVLPWKQLNDYLYSKKLIFFGSENKLSLDINYGRYIKGRDVFVGIEVPVAYKQTRLKFDTDVVPGNGKNADYVEDIYLRTLQRELFDYVLRAKNLYYHEKMSTIGIGDISTLINFNVRTKFVEKLKWGGKIVWPTAKDKDAKKLFAPEIGNGFTQFKLFSSVMFNKQSKYFNPHMFTEFTYSWQGHKDKRVPKVINTDNAVADAVVGADVMALGDRVKYPDQVIAFSEPDSRITAFADNVKSVKIRPGMEFNVRLGNIWEKLIFRRAFMDVYYDFKAKLKDDVLNSGLSETEWQIHRIEENTMMLQHKAGFNFNYQFDIHSRLNLGAEYIFAGINTPDTFNATLGLDVEF